MWKLILLILAGLYTLNPYDILPDLMVGWGWIDDLILWILIWRYFVARGKKMSDYSRYGQNTGGGSGEPGSGTHSEHTASEKWDPYRVLGIDRSASANEIKNAYRDLARKYHPDKLQHLGDEFKTLAEMRFKEIQRAYQELIGKG